MMNESTTWKAPLLENGDLQIKSRTKEQQTEVWNRITLQCGTLDCTVASIQTEKNHHYSWNEKQNFVLAIARILLIVFLCTPFFNGGHGDDNDLRLFKQFRKITHNRRNNTTKSNLIISFWKQSNTKKSKNNKSTIKKMRRRRRTRKDKIRHK